MQSIGESLKNAREQKGISLEQAEEDTKIRKRYLQALEDGEYSIIPGSVYAKGFLRNYANYLGLNQEEIMIEYKLLNTPARETGPRTDIKETITKRRTSNRTNRRAYMISVVVAVIALLTLAAYNFIIGRAPESPGTNDKQAQKPPQSTGTPNKGAEKTNNNNDVSGAKNDNIGSPDSVNPQNPTPGPGQEGNGTVPPMAADKVTVVLRGKGGPSWARVTVDGRVVFTGEIRPGEVQQFSGNTGIKFRLGNAGGVEVSVNGQELGALGGTGEVIDKEYLKD